MASRPSAPQTAFAGARSGVDAVCLDGPLPFAGLVGDTLRAGYQFSRSIDPAPRHPLGSSLRGWFGEEVRDPATSVGVADCETLRSHARSPRKAGCMPRPGVGRAVGNIPGYRGHIPRKEARNVHGGTFRDENERASAAPSRPRRSASSPALTGGLSLTTEGFKVCPRVPGYMGNIPGKHSETIHGATFSHSNEAAQACRWNNPYATAHSFLRNRAWLVDKVSQYHLQARVIGADTESLLTRGELEKASGDSTRLGLTFGMHDSRKKLRAPSCPSGWNQRCDASGRFLHHLRTSASPVSRMDPADARSPVAGKPSISVELEQERWKLHNAVAVGSGNQRCCSGGAF